MSPVAIRTDDNIRELVILYASKSQLQSKSKSKQKINGGETQRAKRAPLVSKLKNKKK